MSLIGTASQYLIPLFILFTVAYGAAKAAGREGEIKFIGIDALPGEGVAWVKSGELTATLLYPTPGEVGLDMAMKILKGEKVEKKVLLKFPGYGPDEIQKLSKPELSDWWWIGDDQMPAEFLPQL